MEKPKIYPAAQGIKKKGIEKIQKIAELERNAQEPRLKKPEWIRAKLPSGEQVAKMKARMRSQHLHSVCEEASCPNLGECFRVGSASFMIMGDICTRRCPFCDVAHGRPNPLDENEPKQLAQTAAELGLAHIVITSVDRDDLLDGGAQHFANCVAEIRKIAPRMSIELLTPDFRGRENKALDILLQNPPDIFNHNLETIPRLYELVRPAANYNNSLNLLKTYKKLSLEKGQKIITKSGLMVGLGEEIEEIIKVMEDLKANNVDMLTIGQYLQPSKYHLNVKKYYTPEEFDYFAKIGKKMGFLHIVSAPMVRSSYHAERSISELGVRSEK